MAMSTAVSLSDNPRPLTDNDANTETAKEPPVSQQDVPKDGGRPTSDAVDGPHATVGRSATMRDKEKKLGHRRVDETGVVTYKKKPTSEIMAAMQLGIGQSIGCLAAKPERDLLMQDFGVVESVVFPSEGSNLTPAHHLSDFRFKTYAPIAFRYFRDLFGIQPEDFMLSLCNEPLRELSNPGASGSIFYITNDDEFIIKTVQHKEAEFLQKLLPGYYMNLNQNPRTLLPKFYALFCYQCGGKNIRFIVMNNLIPSQFKMHEKYDMKGSTYKRKASKQERVKNSPTLKDLDFMQNHPDGIFLERDTFDALFKTLERDCLVLESFKIMDYSFLMSVHNLDMAAKEKATQKGGGLSDDAGSPISIGAASQVSPTSEMVASGMSSNSGPPSGGGVSLQRGKSIRTKLAQYSTAIESITANIEPDEGDNDDIPPGGIPAKNSKGERLLLFLGIIDVLQYYRLKKKFEHTLKSIVIDGDTISVHRPNYFAKRFINFIGQTVFRKIQTLSSFPASTNALKHSPSKKKSQSSRQKTSTSEDPNISQTDRRPMLDKSERTQRTISFSDEVASRPDLLPENATPPPPFSEAVSSENQSVVSTSTRYENSSRYENSTKNTTKITISNTATVHGVGAGDGIRSETVKTHQTVTSEQSASSSVNSLPIIHSSPTLSVSASTPTHTEFTEDVNPSSPAYSPRGKVINSVPTSSTETSYHSALESQEDNTGDSSEMLKS